MENKLRELSEEESKNYKKIGTASGISFGMCMFLAHKHATNFENRVVGFRIEKNGMAEMIDATYAKAGLHKGKNINVTFYENKEEEFEITFIPILHKEMKEFYSPKKDKEDL